MTKLKKKLRLYRSCYNCAYIDLSDNIAGFKPKNQKCIAPKKCKII